MKDRPLAIDAAYPPPTRDDLHAFYRKERAHGNARRLLGWLVFYVAGILAWVLLIRLFLEAI